MTIKDFNEVNVLNEVKSNGFCVIEDFWSKEMCEDGRNSINYTIESHPDLVQKNSSDNRIFGIEYLSELIKNNFYDNDFVNNIFTSLYGTQSFKGTLLGQRVEGTPNNLGSGGSWHRDSLFKQYKAFLFISNVDENSGPFQFQPKSNFNFNKLKASILRGARWNKLDYYEREDLIRAKIDVSNEVSVLCKEGTLLIADTSTVHRGKPGIINDRYSITYYAFEKKIPEHISNLTKLSKDSIATHKPHN